MKTELLLVDNIPQKQILIPHKGHIIKHFLVCSITWWMTTGITPFLWYLSNNQIV